MNPELQQFAKQLAVWTDLIIENGRTPFRRVDLYPDLHTDQGILQPPLIFWINRQSMMAGGILLLPEQDLDKELLRGQSCCDALGLKHFVTWETDQVRIWQIHNSNVQQHQQFSLQDTDHPDAFRHLLGEVLEALKLLAVIGLVPNNQLSPHYLHNLFQTTLSLSQPALINSYRSQRAEDAVTPAEDADQLAKDANRLKLLQLLGLAWHQQLPEAILPEKLERAIQLSLPQLPVPLRETLSAKITANPPTLPNETAVCFHHLLLRLRQLSWRQPEERAIKSMLLLVNSWDNGQQLVGQNVLLYPESPIIDPTTQLILSDSPSLLAAVRLLEDLHQQPNKELRLGNLFQLDLAGQKGLSIGGNMNRRRLLSKEERQQYTALLRTSWPNRRFRISGGKPLWFWELVHLLGLSRQQQILTLTLPLAALQSAATDPLWQLLWESFSIRQLTDLKDEMIELVLSPDANQEEPVTVVTAGQSRCFAVPDSLPKLRNQLLLTLLLPAETYQLLSDKLIWPDSAIRNINALSGLQIYLQSRLYQLLEQILGLELQSLSKAEQAEELLSLPQPDQLHLIELARTDKTASNDQSPDQLLSELLETPAIDAIEVEKEQTRRPATTRATDRILRDEQKQQLQNTGIPNFPEQYLYFLDHPETTSYRLAPPLTIKSEFLGDIELEDADGQVFQIYGKELADALLLCATLGKTEVELPADRQQQELIQLQFWKDLKKLHKELNSLCHSRLESPKAAAKLAQKVWKKLQLPKLKD